MAAPSGLALTFLLAFSVFIVQHHAQQTTVYSTSWDSGTPSGWTTYVRNQNCPCPAATFNFGSISAAHTGAFGLAVNITKPSNQGWHVQLQSPMFTLSPTQVYTACFWVRTTIAGGAEVPMNLIAETNYQWMTGSSVTADASWRQVCVPSFTPNNSSRFYYTLDFGLLTGSVFVDDFTLEATRNTAPEDAIYCNATNVAARIEAYRKGNFTFTFVNRSTNAVLRNAKLTSLKIRLAMHDFPFGSAMEWSGIPNNLKSWYNNTAKKHFNALVPEWSLKWPSYEPSRGVYNSSFNYINKNHIDFATSNDFVLARGHTLEWYISSWGFATHWSRQDGCDNYRTYLQTRITREVTAFRGKFQHYDVFNEVIHELDFVKDCPGMWPGILYDGFRWAAAADPTAQLCLNDYGLITEDDWRAFVQLVRDMKSQGVPIHCIGVQAYLTTQNLRTPVYMKPRLDALAALNLTMLITEYNFWSYWANDTPIWSGTEAEHAALHNEYVRFWFSVPYIKGILMWGFWDTGNWILNGGIYYPNTTAKASARTLATLWGTTWNTTLDRTNVVLPSTGVFGPYNGFYGKYYYEATIGKNKFTGFVRFPASAGNSQTATIAL